MRSALDPITAVPDKATSHGRAWSIDIEAVRAFHGQDPARDGTIASWLIEAEWAHPVWHSYNLVLVHLRQIPGMEPPIIRVPGATHEFWLYVLDPDEPRQAMLSRAKVRWLYPANFAAQLVADSDAAAIARVREAVDLVVDGMLNPDSDALRQWVGIFGDAMLKEEYRK